ncbi:hypothetical protein FB451DRAFT_1180584 [Mycena latifolia]|nr:hypothetical protein FB451DRAFT_1180584 [Mycena latifolia]
MPAPPELLSYIDAHTDIFIVRSHVSSATPPAGSLACSLATAHDQESAGPDPKSVYAPAHDHFVHSPALLVSYLSRSSRARSGGAFFPSSSFVVARVGWYLGALVRGEAGTGGASRRVGAEGYALGNAAERGAKRYTPTANAGASWWMCVPSERERADATSGLGAPRRAVHPPRGSDVYVGEGVSSSCLRLRLRKSAVCLPACVGVLSGPPACARGLPRSEMHVRWFDSPPPCGAVPFQTDTVLSVLWSRCVEASKFERRGRPRGITLAGRVDLAQPQISSITNETGAPHARRALGPHGVPQFKGSIIY